MVALLMTRVAHSRKLGIVQRMVCLAFHVMPGHFRFFLTEMIYVHKRPQMAEEVRFGPDRHRFCDKLSRLVGQNELLLFSPCYHGIVSMGGALICHKSR